MTTAGKSFWRKVTAAEPDGPEHALLTLSCGHTVRSTKVQRRVDCQECRAAPGEAKRPPASHEGEEP